MCKPASWRAPEFSLAEPHQAEFGLRGTYVNKMPRKLIHSYYTYITTLDNMVHWIMLYIVCSSSIGVPFRLIPDYIHHTILSRYI
jgi:hypothetical protein